MMFGFIYIFFFKKKIILDAKILKFTELINISSYYEINTKVIRFYEYKIKYIFIY